MDDEINMLIGRAYRAALDRPTTENPEGDRVRAEAEAEMQSGYVTINGVTFPAMRHGDVVEVGPHVFRHHCIL